VKLVHELTNSLQARMRENSKRTYYIVVSLNKKVIEAKSSDKNVAI